MSAWINVLDAPGCYESAARVERKSALQGSGLVITVGPCAQRRVALMPQAIEMHCRMIGAKAPRSSRGLGACAGASHRASSEVRGEVCSLSYLSVVRWQCSSRARTSPLHTLIVGARAVACYEGCGLCNPFNLRMRTILILPKSLYFVSMYC